MELHQRFPILFCLALLVVFAALPVPVCSAAADKQRVIDGMVIRTDQGLIVAAEDGDYLIKGRDLSKMEGKLVEVTGIVVKTGNVRVIRVKNFQELQE